MFNLTGADIVNQSFATKFFDGMTTFQSGTQAGLWANTGAYTSKLQQVGYQSIAQYMSLNTGTVAEAQLDGTDIYINAAYVNQMSPGEQEAMVLHEMIHNITGLTDDVLQLALGLSTNAPSVNISDKLQQDCVNQ